MAHGKFVAYYRVSTQKQGQSGLGLEAQKAGVLSYLDGGGWKLIEEFTEVETGKGANALDRRPQLCAALALCKKQKATLVIAKLDRLARNVHFVSGLIESGVEFVAADMPQANKTMIQMYAVMSEWERDAISKRTKEALAAAKARGVKLGTAGPANLRRAIKLGTAGPANLRHVIEQRQAEAAAYAEGLRGVMLGLKSLSQRAIRDKLNDDDIAAPRGGQWHLQTVQRVMARLQPA
jgi:DNA invertase Pin-like site-specific DNA recombinase